MNDYTPLRIKTSFFQRRGSFLLFLVAMGLLGFLTQFQWVGYCILLVYTIICLVKKYPARITFITALLTLGMVVVSIIIANWLVAQNFTAYTFVLLFLGVIQTTLELKREPRQAE